MSLHDLFVEHNTEKKDHGYGPYYERHLPRRDAKFKLIECGVLRGESLQAWRVWFPHAQIIGIDDERHGDVADASGCTVWRANVLDVSTTPCDVFIDDGSHKRMDMVKTFQRWWPAVSLGGLYVVEDILSQYWDRFNNSKVSMMDVAKELLDCVNRGGAWPGGGTWPMEPPTVVNTYKGVVELHAYYGILFLRKGQP